MSSPEVPFCKDFKECFHDMLNSWTRYTFTILSMFICIFIFQRNLLHPHFLWYKAPPPVPDGSTVMAGSASGHVLMSSVTNNYCLTLNWQTSIGNSIIMKIASIKRTCHGWYCTSSCDIYFNVISTLNKYTKNCTFNYKSPSHIACFIIGYFIFWNRTFTDPLHR